jgi:hypothetical protein
MNACLSKAAVKGLAPEFKSQLAASYRTGTCLTLLGWPLMRRPTTAEELRVKAQELYSQADKTANADERLTLILRALELEADAGEWERKQRSQPGGGEGGR